MKMVCLIESTLSYGEDSNSIFLLMSKVEPSKVERENSVRPSSVDGISSTRPPLPSVDDTQLMGSVVRLFGCPTPRSRVVVTHMNLYLEDSGQSSVRSNRPSLRIE